VTKPRKPSQLLRATRKLISEPASWTKGYMARDALGSPCALLSEAAVRFCVVGALRRVTRPGEDWTRAWYYLRDCSPKGVSTVNDTGTHEQVMAWLSDSITAAKRAESIGS
jgi:hypothetical protein